MSLNRALIVAASLLVITVLGTGLFLSKAQENQSRIAHSNGSGTLRVGDEQFKINSVIVKLIDDRKAELTLVSDITIFLTATWSSHADSQQEFDLQMTEEARGGVEGTGKVVLSDDGKSVAQLTLKGISRATKRPVEASFKGK